MAEPDRNASAPISDELKPVAWRWHVGRGWNYTDSKPSFEPRELPRVFGPIPLYAADALEAAATEAPGYHLTPEDCSLLRQMLELQRGDLNHDGLRLYREFVRVERALSNQQEGTK